MCRFESTGVSNLYCHESRKEHIFLYTREGCPSSLSQCFIKGRFLLLFCGWPVKDGEEEKKQEEKKQQKLAEAAESLWADTGGRADGCFAFVERESYFYQNWKVMELQKKEDAIYALKRGVRFPLRGYRFSIPAGTSASVEEKDGEEKIVMKKGTRGYAMEFLTEGISSSRNTAFSLLMEGDTAGCFSFGMELSEGFHQLGAGIRFSMERESPEHGNYVDTLSCMPFYPLFSPLLLEVLLDAADPGNSKRSRFLLPSGRYGSFFPAFCRENLILKAEPGELSLVFEKEKIYRSNQWYVRYLSPEGRARIEGDSAALLPGISGLEYVKFEKGAYLYFHSGKEAYFPVRGEDKMLSGTAPYLSVSSGVYYSQGDASSFFGEIGKGQTVLSYQEVPFKKLDAQTVFPVLPVGIQEIPQKSLEKLIAMDTAKLSHLRSRIIGGAAENETAIADAVTAITEKGILASFCPGAMSFLTVEIADKFRLSDVKGSIRQALLSPQAFLLISDSQDFLKYASVMAETEPMSADGWSFDFNPALWEKNKTLILMKYTKHKSVRELCKAPDQWSYPAREELVRKNQDLLEKIIKDIDAKKETEAFIPAEEILDDKDWCGVIAFSVQVEGDALPDDIRFLAGAVDGPLLAHHLIFDSRTAGRSGEILPSSVSGVICYEDPLHPVLEEPGEFYYKLDLLLVSIRDSAVEDFQCSLSLSLQYFLRSPLYGSDSALGNYMIIRGGMTKKKEDEGLNEYYFTLSEPKTYRIDGSAIDTLCVEGAGVMASCKDERIRFFLSGNMKFWRYESDLFSYGDEESGLYFKNLLLVCRGNAFQMDVSSMEFLMDQSRAREGSLGEQFPLSWKQFFVMEDKKGPEKLGYTAVHCDGIRQEEPGEVFVCAKMEVDLGGLGSLSSAGDLKLSLLAAWTPYRSENKYDGSVEAKEPGIYLGASLGAFSGVSSPIPLEGVMSMGFDSVELKKSAKTGEFYLYFRNFFVKLLKYQFPDGNNDIYVFGNAENPKKLGWYGAYEAKEKKDVCEMQRTVCGAGSRESD